MRNNYTANKAFLDKYFTKQVRYKLMGKSVPYKFGIKNDTQNCINNQDSTSHLPKYIQDFQAMSLVSRVQYVNHTLSPPFFAVLNNWNPSIKHYAGRGTRQLTGKSTYCSIKGTPTIIWLPWSFPNSWVLQ